MKHTHKFIAYKEIDIPNGKYLVNKGAIDMKNIGGTPYEHMIPLTDNVLILYCSKCGEIKGKNLNKIRRTNTHANI